MNAMHAWLSVAAWLLAASAAAETAPAGAPAAPADLSCKSKPSGAKPPSGSVLSPPGPVLSQVTSVTCPAPAATAGPAPAPPSSPRSPPPSSPSSLASPASAPPASLLPHVPVLGASILVVLVSLVAGAAALFQALRGGSGGQANTSLMPEGFTLRRHWGSFGAESTGWSISSRLATLLIGLVSIGIAAALMLRLLDAAYPPAPGSPAAEKPAAATTPVKDLGKSALPADGR